MHMFDHVVAEFAGSMIEQRKRFKIFLLEKSGEFSWKTTWGISREEAEKIIADNPEKIYMILGGK